MKRTARAIALAAATLATMAGGKSGFENLTGLSDEILDGYWKHAMVPCAAHARGKGRNEARRYIRQVRKSYPEWAALMNRSFEQQQMTSKLPMYGPMNSREQKNAYLDMFNVLVKTEACKLQSR